MNEFAREENELIAVSRKVARAIINLKLSMNITARVIGYLVGGNNFRN